ncbi:hypothetical protein ES708_30419 [subsurface metagenome]
MEKGDVTGINEEDIAGEEKAEKSYDYEADVTKWMEVV